MDEPHLIKELYWIGSSRKDLKAFPDEVKRVVGFALYQAQMGLIAPSAKALSGRTYQVKTRVRTMRVRKPKADHQKVEASSGNVFADLGLKDPEELLLKAKLATKIGQLIGKKGWTQSQTAERIKLDQPKVSRLLRGQLSGFSVDRLFAILNRLGHSVEVRISAKERAPEKSHTRVSIG